MQPLDVASLTYAAAVETAPAELAEPLRVVLSSRGKGIRPAIVFEAARCGPGADGESVQMAAHAVELLHIATITHDDVIDHGELRRGVPTIAAECGSHMAVTVGVWLLGRVAELLIDCGPGILAHASGSIAQMCDGQLLEARDLFNPDRTVADYQETIAGKTAALFALSAWLGATLAGAPSAVVKALQRYGHELGVAYQIADDLGDLLREDPTKHPGSDLREGVYTLPVIYAIQAEPRLRELLTQTPTTANIERIVQTATHTGALTRTRRHCHHHARAAAHTLHQIPTPQPLLEGLTQSIRAMCDG